jgi:hypothetical protein
MRLAVALMMIALCAMLNTVEVFGQPCEWVPGMEFKMHFPQLPDEDGWDVNASSPRILADDFLCAESGWIKDIHCWGSWKDGIESPILGFVLSFHSDIPKNPPDIPYSRPGALLWERTITNFTVKPFDPTTPEGWYDPSTGETLPNNHQRYYQYNVCLDSADWFNQQEGTVYWLNVSAILEDTTARWGWKSTENHWNDDAVFATLRCVVAGNGAGTVDLPADCPLGSDTETMDIVDGLPPGTTVESKPTVTNFICPMSPSGVCSSVLPPGICEGAGGSLGGNFHCFEATLSLDMTGTGSLSGYGRLIDVPISAEVHTAPRTPGLSVQSFDTDMFRLFGQIMGDPDFDLLRITAGTDFGMPSPGHTTLRLQPGGNWSVDSFFDITYRIDFVGHPGGPFSGMSGSTTGTIRMTQGGDQWTDMYEPNPLLPITNQFFVQFDPTGNFAGGGGTDFFGDGWYFYPQTNWWNIWFYDHPYDEARYKTVTVEFEIMPMQPGLPAFVELAVNWSTARWSIEQPPADSAPPLPGVTPEDFYIGRATVFSGEFTSGLHTATYVIPDYNPEWVSIDIRGFNFVVPFGRITHECRPKNPQSLDLSFVITGDPFAPCQTLIGEADGTGFIDIDDIVYLITYVFGGGSTPVPFPVASGDANCSCFVDIDDIVYLITYVFAGGPAPCTCEQWISICGALH